MFKEIVVFEACAADDPSLRPNRDAPRDLANCGVGIIWRLTLQTIPVYIIFRNFTGTLVSVFVFIGTTVFLKKVWYDNLKKEEIWMGETKNRELPAVSGTQHVAGLDHSIRSTDDLKAAE